MEGMFRDYTEEAAALMQKADAGDAEAQYHFATYLLREPDNSYRKDLTPDEVERGIHYLQLSAAQGYFYGMAADDLGRIYFDGVIVQKDYKKAKMWFLTAEMKGIPTATYMLGECAYFGYDEDVSYEKAAMCYLKAAPRYINAVMRLGDMYVHGEYLPLDTAFAKELYEHVCVSEDWYHKKTGVYSDAYEMVLQRLREIENAGSLIQPVRMDETEEQVNVRKALLEIMEDEKKRWQKWGDE